MATPRLSEDKMREVLAAVEKYGSVAGAARELRIPRETLRSQVDRARGELVKPRVRVKAISEPTGSPKIKNPAPAAAYVTGAKHAFMINDDHTFAFGAMGDTHLGSKYERLDVLNALYDIYEDEGIKTVFHAGNWVDGEASFNVHDLNIHGMHGQCEYLAKHYPKRAGVMTYAVTGDDHEGWYAQRTGVDIGDYAARAFERAGREDWVNLGYMEAPVLLRNASSGKEAVVSVVHPGGGSAYALSYTMQKMVESLDGGEKPAILLAGHYHKLWFGNIRNVWAIQTGCTQDQTPFMRKKKIDAHIGGCIVRGRQDPKTGAIVRCSVEILRYFNRGYYGGRWSHSGGVTLPARSLGGI